MDTIAVKKNGSDYEKAELHPITSNNIDQLKFLNTVIFPVVYEDRFYEAALRAGELAKLAYYDGTAVGAICCRIDLKPDRRIYIMTLGIHYRFRRLGIGSKLVRHVIDYANHDGKFRSMYLHVQVSNIPAIKFYRNFGFQIVDVKKCYYRRIEPPDAYELEKMF